jgi:hypothetical protein
VEVRRHCWSVRAPLPTIIEIGSQRRVGSERKPISAHAFFGLTNTLRRGVVLRHLPAGLGPYHLDAVLLGPDFTTQKGIPAYSFAADAV